MRFLTLPEVAQLFKVAEKTIYTMVSRHSGAGAWRFKREDLDK